jgi:hypothetical protein
MKRKKPTIYQLRAWNLLKGNKNRLGKKKEKSMVDGWVLYSGLYSINWKNGVPIEFEVDGTILKVKS